MITFKRFLAEAFNKPYAFGIENIETDGKYTEYRISFNALSGRYEVYVLYSKSTGNIRIDFTDEDVNDIVTGSEGMQSIRIFSTLYDIIKQALITHPKAGVQFESPGNQPSKVKLYRSLAKRLAIKLKKRVSEQQVSGGNIRFIIK